MKAALTCLTMLALLGCRRDRGALDSAEEGSGEEAEDESTGLFSLEAELELATAHAVLYGTDENAFAGTSVAGAGDLDGDGYGDLVIGGPNADSEGAAWLVYGSVSIAGELRADATVRGFASTSPAGMSVASAGDVDADGFDDVLVGTQTWWREPFRAYLLYGGGRERGELVGDAAICDDEGGYDAAVGGGGDLNGDGFDDMLLGSPDLDGVGAVFVVLGANDLPTMEAAYAGWNDCNSDIMRADAELEPDEGSRAGASVAVVPDLDGDGLDELLIGAPDDPWEATGAGHAWLVLGAADLPEALSPDARLEGEVTGDGLGAAVAGTGDVDGDGHGDLMIGAPGDDTVAVDAGAALLVLGSSSPGRTLSAEAALYGSEGNNALGTSVAGAGDLDGDGHRDLLIGVPGESVGWESTQGSGRLILGASDLSGTMETASLLLGQGGGAGWSVAGAGDVDADGRDDLLIGAPYDSTDRDSAGAAYLVLARGW